MIHFTSGVTPNDPLAVGIVIFAVLVLAVCFFVAKHNLKDRS